ncbi:MAG: cytochrome c-type biogenesis protein CcmH [Rhodospirillales bacterium]|nr:cytochrome c-type biogenesis protein CcmH [Rhodospirillales bacterium]
MAWLAPSLAVEPDEVLADPTLESRARGISQGLRCLVCQNQSIDDSDAELARDLRLLVRERLVAGDDDQQVIDYIVSRYGDFVLLKPPFKLATLALWAAPAVILLVAGVAVFLYYRQSATAGGAEAAPAPLSQAEQQRLETILRDRDVSS